MAIVHRQATAINRLEDLCIQRFHKLDFVVVTATNSRADVAFGSFFAMTDAIQGTLSQDTVVATVSVDVADKDQLIHNLQVLFRGMATRRLRQIRDLVLELPVHDGVIHLADALLAHQVMHFFQGFRCRIVPFIRDEQHVDTKLRYPDDLERIDVEQVSPDLHRLIQPFKPGRLIPIMAWRTAQHPQLDIHCFAQAQHVDDPLVNHTDRVMREVQQVIVHVARKDDHIQLGGFHVTWKHAFVSEGHLGRRIFHVSEVQVACRSNAKFIGDRSDHYWFLFRGGRHHRSRVAASPCSVHRPC